MTMAEHNDLIPLLRVIAMPTTKQPGRRYGPAPKHEPRPGMQAPRPMTTGDRDRVYRIHPNFLAITDRQARRWIRMAERHGEIVREGRKGSPTLKQKKVRRG